ncbi:MAG: M43 family zinc metalloprotease [Flavisolibacter sp.]
MKKLLLSFLGLLPFLSYAQDLLPSKKRCATYEVLQNYRKLHPGAETDQQFETWLGKTRASRKMGNSLSTVTLPIVFHIIYNGEAEGMGTNISQAAIQQQMLQLNKDYANQSNSPYAVAADANIQFALAQTDALGNTLAEPGIDRIDRNAKGFTAPPYTVGYANATDNYLTSTIKPATIWDPNKYINIWVLQMENGILGIATFPASSGLTGISGSETDQTAGVAIVPTSVGSVFVPGNCSGYTKGKTLTHELGHFFGLRHIWGDASCGDDYCSDTPVHEGPNSGIPTHPKPNNCGTADEMFENYMDYSSDAVLNTFTAGQVSRMQTVLANSPRRNTLAGSPAGLVSVTASNQISFADCSSLITSETGTTGTYPRYHDLSFTIIAEDQATGNATVTLNPSGTAIGNFHYQLLTPSLNFVAGDRSKVVMVRILDNAEVDGSRTLTLGYSISGSGVQAGSAMQSITLTITDDDNITVSQNQVNLLSQNFEGSVSGWSVLATSGMPNLFRVSNGGDAGGTGNCAYISSSTAAPFANSYNKNVSGVSVLRTPLVDASGVSNLQLSFHYKVWGEADASSAYDYGMITYATPASPNSFLSTGASGAGPYAGISAPISGNPTISLPDNNFSNQRFYLGFYWENDDNSGNDAPWNIDDILLTGTGTNVENTIASSYGYDLPSGSGTNYFRSANNRIIAKLTNAASPVSGITASVTQAGTGQVSITTAGGTFLRTEKVIQISPASPNATVGYEATLYFTEAELAVWGAGKLNLKILKIHDGVSLSDPISTSNATLITPTAVTENLAGGFIAYTGNFTGFSQFVLVSPNFTLPVSLVSFDAKPAKKTILLSWETVTENNNKGFMVERSVNGTDFRQIGWVAGGGTVNAFRAYGYEDRFVQPNIPYYYRLRQVDGDGHQTLSAIRQASLALTGLRLSVFPNPARDRVSLFLSGATDRAELSLVNTRGQVVASWSQADLSAPYNLVLGHLAKGHYTLLVHLKNQTISSPLLIQ